MKTKWIKKGFLYDGSQLKSHYNYLAHGLEGDSAVAWRGPCRISFPHMADGEDLRQQAEIAGSDMLHFVIEKFHKPLSTGVALQRLFAAIVKDCLKQSSPEPAPDLRREGDDLYLDDRKLTISVATVSPVSTLIHFAINITNRGTPVPTVSLTDLGVDPRELALELLEKLSREIESLDRATRKVRPVTAYRTDGE